MATWSERLADLERIAALKDDWDGEGTPAPDAEAVAYARRLFDSWIAQGGDPPNCVSAGVNATVICEWYFPMAYFEAEVLAGEVRYRTSPWHEHVGV